MSDREKLKSWVLEAVHSANEPISVVEVAKHIWDHHERDLKASGDLFYTWQYSMRWAAQVLREEKKLVLVGKKWAAR